MRGKLFSDASTFQHGRATPRSVCLLFYAYSLTRRRVKSIPNQPLQTKEMNSGFEAATANESWMIIGAHDRRRPVELSTSAEEKELASYRLTGKPRSPFS